MIRIILSLLPSYMLVGCNQGQAKITQSESTSEDTFLIKVEEMGCRSCMRRIKKYLYEKEGIQSVKANIPERTLTFKKTSENYQSPAHLKLLSQKAIIGESNDRTCKVCSNGQKK